jgi:alkylation response protein AidB-like acyl-CoA dehydrogenase
VSRVDRTDLGDPLVTSSDVETLRRIRRVLSILTSAQLAGIACATSDLAIIYAKSRVQFGKPIGAFQAIKHKCADMATNALAAENVTYFAALSETDRSRDSEYETLAAAAFCRRAAFENARLNVQLHGAMGFTVEDSAHRFVKRVHTLCSVEGFDKSAERLGALPSLRTNEES